MSQLTVFWVADKVLNAEKGGHKVPLNLPKLGDDVARVSNEGSIEGSKDGTDDDEIILVGEDEAVGDDGRVFVIWTVA